ncbi:MAG: 5'-nucleotidase C-terminal domain-containing protein [Nocardioidaceae bacterium]|nr:5'-nucleotidase C-terminal domain-containing protein [Nocardioidaceae bacterium]
MATTVAAAVVLAPVALLLPASPAHAADGDVTINLLLSNDFHGRINNNTVKWAWKIEDLRTNTVADGGLLIGAGDMIGASEFASAVQEDQPTIDVMNAIGLDASAVGNHEFDRGWDDLRNRVIDNGANAAWDYLGANVYEKGTTNPVLPPFMTYDINGVTVGVIGAVTAETTSLVSPAGISTLDFGDPIEAVNRVAADLTDGDGANGEADVIVATFHQGAEVGAGSDFDTEVAKGGEFAEMANLNPAVDVVFNGHTHQTYAWDAPNLGGDLATRPFLQTGSYGSNIGQVVLTYNTTADAVTGYTVANQAVPTSGVNADLVAQYPSVLGPIDTTVTDALAYAASIGNEPIAEQTSDITTAFSAGSYVDGSYTGGTRDDRASESTMGDLVANALRDGIPADMGTPDLGIVNPGGLRNEFYYAADTSTNPNNTDGVITYSEANNVLPFINNIWLVDLTGAQLKTVLEQQWQRDASGNVPSRPYLMLGLSDNVTVTRDPSRDEGDRITSVTIDGQPLSMTKHYSVSTFSFLATGGDNFRAFTEGTSKDTGLIDRDLWISYLQDRALLAPDFARQQIDESGMPATVSPGDQVTFTLDKLDLTSLGAPENTSVKLYARTASSQIDLGTFPVTDGMATIDLLVPAKVPNRSPLVVMALPSMTMAGKGLTASTVTATADPITYGAAGAVEVTVDPVAATGSVDVLDGADVIGTGTLTAGAASILVPAGTLSPGSHSLIVSYGGDATTAGASTAVTVEVTKATPTISIKTKPAKVVVKKTRPRVMVTVAGAGDTPTGSVAVITGGRTYVVDLVAGKASVRVGPFAKTGNRSVVIRYFGDDLYKTAKKTTTIKVVKK